MYYKIVCVTSETKKLNIIILYKMDLTKYEKMINNNIYDDFIINIVNNKNNGENLWKDCMSLYSVFIPDVNEPSRAYLYTKYLFMVFVLDDIYEKDEYIYNNRLSEQKEERLLFENIINEICNKLDNISAKLFLYYNCEWINSLSDEKQFIKLKCENKFLLLDIKTRSGCTKPSFILNLHSKGFNMLLFEQSLPLWNEFKNLSDIVNNYVCLDNDLKSFKNEKNSYGSSNVLKLGNDKKDLKYLNEMLLYYEKQIKLFDITEHKEIFIKLSSDFMYGNKLWQSQCHRYKYM